MSAPLSLPSMGRALFFCVLNFFVLSSDLLMLFAFVPFQLIYNFMYLSMPPATCGSYHWLWSCSSGWSRRRWHGHFILLMLSLLLVEEYVQNSVI